MDIPQRKNKDKTIEVGTSYFGNMKNIGYDYIPVSIARYTPKGVYCRWEFKELAPPEFLLKAYKNKIVDESAYVELYNREVLEKLDIAKLKDKISKITEETGKKVVLLCYEKPEDFCHRHLLSSYLSIYGIRIKEV